MITAEIIFGADQPIGNRRQLERLPGDGYAYVLIDDCVRIEMRHLRREYGGLHAEADVQCAWASADHHEGHLSCADLNLSSQPARKTLATYCAERSKAKPADFDWMGVIDAACLETIRAERTGAAVITLDDADETPDRDIDVCGLEIPMDATSLLIAHGDSLKSLLLLLILGTLAKLDKVVLLLDWEWTAARHMARKRRLFGETRIEGLRYLRCQAPLTVERDRIRRYCDEHHVEFIGGDSVGLACDGKLADDDTAIRFHRALTSLPPALFAAHVPKSSLTADASKSDPIGPFGSVFFSNLCRMTWVLKKQHGADDNLVTVGCFPQKQNDGARKKPVGLEFTFQRESIGVRSVDLAAVDGLAERLPIRTRIEAALKRGPMTYAALADELSVKVDSVQKAVKRDHEKFVVVSGQPDGIQRIALKSLRVA